MTNNDTYLFVYATNFIITLHVSALIGHLQVFPFIQTLSTIELQRAI
jgi:hypothetical protein